MDQLAELVSKYGFPIVAAGGMGWMIHYVWTWVTQEVKPVLSEANTVLIALIDRIRMLDNDLLRLREKLTMVQEIKHDEKDAQLQKDLIKVDVIPAKVSKPLDGKMPTNKPAAKVDESSTP